MPSSALSSLLAFTLRLLTGVQTRGPLSPPGTSAPGTQHDLSTGHSALRTPCIYFANHRSNLDAPVIWAALPPDLRARTRPVAARDYWDAGPLRRLLATRGFNAVLIERRKVTRASNPLVPMEAALAAGDSLILFPEGTRGPDATPDGDPESPPAFKPGLYHLARAFPAVDLVPTYLENLNRILPKGEFLPLPLIAAVRFGPPTRLLPTEDKPAFLARARTLLYALSPHPPP